MATIIDGKAVSRKIREEIKKTTAELARERGKVPGLAVVVAGKDPASQVYVRMKEKACAYTGIASRVHRLEANTPEEEILELIGALNRDRSVNGILVQLPLPRQLPEARILEAVDPDKDVDGFHPINAGRLWRGEETFAPCTPAGIIELLRRYEIPTAGRHAVIVGRSNIVGRPLAAMLLRKGPGGDATVTVCHSRTPDLGRTVATGDIVVAAVGAAGTITGPMIRKGATVIDVGVNEIGRSAEGKRILTGDVDFEQVRMKAGAITPVPGGVGPMTIAMLLSNTLKAFRLQEEPT